MNIPSELIDELRRAEELEEQREADPQLADTLISLYQEILARVDRHRYPDLYANLQDSLGIIYYEYEAEDRTAYLELRLRG